MTPTEALIGASYADAIRELSRELCDLYAVTPDPVRVAGRAWYPSAAREARELSRRGPRGFGPVRAAGVIAALSPRAQWSVNLEWSRAIIAAAANYWGRVPDDAELPAPPRVSMGDNRAKAWRIALGADPEGILGGLKVRSFWRNIAGDPEAVTLDVWACRAAGVGDLWPPTARRYAVLAAAYRAAARECGESPADLQAILWMQVRGVKPTDPASYRPLTEAR